MPIKFKFEDSYKGAWILLRQAYNLILKCEDRVFSEYGITMEQHAVLMTIKHIRKPVRITDVALWLDRSVNSVSMIVDRMVKAGLLKRVRDRSDRRVVNVSITSKAENSLGPATRAGWEFIQKITSPLSNEDKHAFIRQHDTLRYEIFKYLYPGVNVDEMARDDDEGHANLMERLVQYALSSTPKVKR